MLPMVTIITPVYKKRNTIIESINSVLLQDYSKIEYIIVDDGPNSVIDDELLPLFFNSPIELHIMHNKINMGTPYSLNKAISAASGDYVINLADDDVLIDSKVVSDWVHEFIVSGADIITAKCAMYDDTLDNLLQFLPSSKDIESIKNSTPEELFELMVGHNFILGSITAKTRSFLLTEIGMYNEMYHIIEDYPSIMVALRNNIHVHFFDRIVIKYRDGGISSPPNINGKYLRESDLIFRREILPYTRHKIKAFASYRRWKRSVNHSLKNK